MQCFCQNGRRPTIGTTNFKGILHHSYFLCKEAKNFKNLMFCEDYHKLIQTQFLIQSPLGMQSGVHVEKPIAGAWQ